MTRPAILIATAVLGALALAPASAHAHPKNLWATVNVCDTRSSPDRMGVRARMPGDDAHERMFMRFTAQFHSGRSWRRVSGKGDSPWLYAGSALFKTQELGYTFTFDAPEPGAGYLMRGLVQFQWRAQRRGRAVVVHRTHLYTEGHHPSRGADPEGHSAGRCRVSTPGVR